MRRVSAPTCNCPAAGQLQTGHPEPASAAGRLLAALLSLHTKGPRRFRANILAERLWPDTRGQNANGQVFNLAAGVAGRLLRRSPAVREVARGEWEIRPHRLQVELAEAQRRAQEGLAGQRRDSGQRTYGAATAADADLTTSTAVALAAAVPTSALGAS